MRRFVQTALLCASLFGFGVPEAAAQTKYIADPASHVIRKLESSGFMSTFAGTPGTSGFGGDGADATQALLASPAGVAVDSFGNVYIADTFNSRIRTVSAKTGIITTVAGTGAFGWAGDEGPAANALLNRPEGLWVDAAGNLLIADSQNDRVRKVDQASGVIHTVAGGGANRGFAGDGDLAQLATLDHPVAVATDAAGNIYIADFYHQAVRKVTAATGIISTVAGTAPYSGFSGEGGPATSAALYNPTGVAVDAAGNLFIADSRNGRIRRVDAKTGVIDTVAGTGMDGACCDSDAATEANLHAPGGIAVDSEGALFVADPAGNSVRRIKAQGAKRLRTRLNGICCPADDPDDPDCWDGLPECPFSSVSLTSSQNPASAGTPITIRATISPSTATGTVTFSPGGTATVTNGLASVNLTMGSASFTVTAVYSGDANYPGSSTSMVQALPIQCTPPQVLSGGGCILPTSTTTTLSSSLNPSTFGQVVTFTATVSPAASGSVVFRDGATMLSNVTLNNGVATYSTSGLGSEPHSITAGFVSLSSSYSNSTSPALTQTVNGSQTSTALSSSLNPATFGQSVTLTAAVTPSLATGVVTFSDGVSILGTGTVSGGFASFSTSSLGVGTHSLTAAYGGSGSHSPSTSNVVTQTVKSLTSTVLSSSSYLSIPSQSITLTATVTPSTATGVVNFLDGGSPIGTGALSGGVASFSTSALSVGNHSLTAVYGGDSGSAASTSAAVTQTVFTLALIITSPNSSVYSDAVTLRATVTPSSVSGIVTFADGAVTLGSVALVGGVASLSTSALDAGSHLLTAYYGAGSGGGGGGAAPIASASLSHAVDPKAVTITLSGLNFTYDGTPKTVTATPSIPGLTVSITYNGSNAAPTAVGTYTVLATVVDPNYTGSRTGTLIISQAPGSGSGSGSGSTPTPANLVITRTMTRTGGNIVVTFTFTNTGGTAANSVSLRTVKIGTTSGTPLPFTVGSIAAGGSVQVIETIPGSAGASGAASSLSIAGVYTGGSFSSASRITLP